MKNAVLILCLATFAFGCSFAYRNTVGLFEDGDSRRLEPAPPRSERAAEEAPPSATVAIEKLPEKQDTPQSDEIEIIWEIPSQTVDGYLLKYGFSAGELTLEKRLPLEEIERYVHPSFGPVYRYILHGIPAEKRVYVALATVQDDEISELSEVFEVTPSTESTENESETPGLDD